MTNEKLHDLKTILTQEEIEELRDICYTNGNSWFPVSDFFNDIERTQNPNFDKNRAYKDLWLIVNIVLEDNKDSKALKIIKEKQVDVHALIYYFKQGVDNDTVKCWYNEYIVEFNEYRELTEKEVALLKETLL